MTSCTNCASLKAANGGSFSREVASQTPSSACGLHIPKKLCKESSGRATTQENVESFGTINKPQVNSLGQKAE